MWAEVELWISALLLLAVTATFARREPMSSEVAVGR
jgi:hypothetical protein